MAKLNNSIAAATYDDMLQTLFYRLFEAPINSHNSARVMDDILARLGQQLRCDRVFLYLRSPQSALGRVPFCWCDRPTVPTVHDSNWKPEPAVLVKDDPMFAAALNAQPSIFVEDVNTASSKVVNRDFERETFGHRALIHAHLCSEQKLWGILQACVFEAPRAWSEGDRQLIEQTVSGLTPFAIDYVSTHAP